MEKACGKEVPFAENPAAQYAAVRNGLYQKGKKIEIMVNYQPKLHFFSEWWKQLYGESEGKDGKGIFPASVDFTTDLHSMGQWIQEGERTIFETVISIEEPEKKLLFPEDEENLDGLNFLEIACGISGNILGVNPFNQPGVEAYKKNMFALLGKPGYEKESEAIKARL